ncbi:MAG: polysaccharide biosynthesis/export family protein [Nitrospira sp.]|nr:polysaccharide biosynthesis/export family protein [Nitrospira sp.]
MSQLPFGRESYPAYSLPLASSGPPGNQPGSSPGQPVDRKEAFTAELLRQQDFNVEEAFAEFSVLHGVKSRVRQFGYDFFEAQANTFSPIQDIPVGPDFIVGPQDSLAVHIWNVPDPSFNRSFIVPVERDGMIVIPQVGAIPVGGQTFSQAEQTIHARLSMLLKRFELHVSMARIRTIKVYVVGEVARPGRLRNQRVGHRVECAVCRLRPGPFRIVAPGQGDARGEDRRGIGPV